MAGRADAGPRTRGGGGGRGGAAARDRLRGAVPPSPGAVGRLRRRVCRGSPRRHLGARRGDRCRERSGPSGVAPGCCGHRAGRRRGHRARAVGGPDPGTRRTGGRGGVPPAVGGADRRAGTARRPSPGGSPRAPARRRVRRRRWACWPRPRPTRSTISSGPGWSSSGERSSGHRAPGARHRSCCCRPPSDSSHSISGSPGRPISTPGGPPSSPVLSPRPAASCWRCPPRHDRPLGAPQGSAGRRPPPRRSGDDDPRLTGGGCERACGKRWTRSSVSRCPPTSGCTGGSSPRTRRSPCGTSTAGPA